MKKYLTPTLLVLFLFVFALLSFSFPSSKKNIKRDIIWNFDKNTKTMGWKKAWGKAFDPDRDPVEFTTILASSNNFGSLKVNLGFVGKSWEDASIGMWFGEENKKFDLSRYETIEYDIYIPDPGSFTGLFKVASALGNDFVQITDFKDFKIYEMDTIKINGNDYVKIHISDKIGEVNRLKSGMFVIRFAGYMCEYTGPVYVDNVIVKLSRSVKIYFSSPKKYEEISGKYNVISKINIAEGINIKKATLLTQNGDSYRLKKIPNGQYKCIWDTTKHEGYQTIKIEVIDENLQEYTKEINVLVKNSKTKISIVSPEFDSTISGIYNIKADVEGPADKVILRIGDIDLPMKKGDSNNSYSIDLDTKKLEDGVYTLIIEAEDPKYKIKEITDIIIENDQSMKYFVKRSGANFILNKKKYFFVGFNAYDLPFKSNTLLQSNTIGVSYTSEGEKIVTSITKNSLSFEEQTDRTMIEARKIGMTVLRTWGFNTDVDQDHSFYTKDWDLKGSQFKRFDYIMDSARRHGIRVIIVFQNYWDDFGGIYETTKMLGLKNKLEFFTNRSAKEMFKKYIKFFINRINTKNNIRYADDPTIFAWELMNEPRMDSEHDTTKDKRLYDKDGSKLSKWIDEISTFIKSLDKNHLVAAGSEGHGFKGWQENPHEGYGTDPVKVMDQPNTDFITFHPYPNAERYRYTLDRTNELIRDFVKDSLDHNKPVVLGEYGINKNELLKDMNGNDILPDDPKFHDLRVKWYKSMLKTFRESGGNGSLLWMLQTSLQEKNYGITVYTPAEEAENDRDFVNILLKEAELVEMLNK